MSTPLQRIALAILIALQLLTLDIVLTPIAQGADPCPGVELMIQPQPLPSCPAVTPTPEQDIGTPGTFVPLPDTAMEAPR